MTVYLYGSDRFHNDSISDLHIKLESHCLSHLADYILHPSSEDSCAAVRDIQSISAYRYQNCPELVNLIQQCWFYYPDLHRGSSDCFIEINGRLFPAHEAMCEAQFTYLQEIDSCFCPARWHFDRIFNASERSQSVYQYLEYGEYEEVCHLDDIATSSCVCIDNWREVALKYPDSAYIQKRCRELAVEEFSCRGLSYEEGLDHSQFDLKVDLYGGFSLDDYFALCDTLRRYFSREFIWLDCSCIGLGDFGVYSVCSRLECNRSIRGITLAQNAISSKGVEAIADMLKQNTTLERLNLWDNAIGSEGACVLASAVSCNRTLKRLSLGKNDLGSVGTWDIVRALRNNTSLKVLDLGYNDLQLSGARAAAELIQKSRCLAALCLDGNGLSDTGAELILDALECRCSQTLEYLNMSCNNLSYSMELRLKVLDLKTEGLSIIVD